MQYQEYLKDKTVAIVGSSSHLIGRNEGEFIDSHDVVVRTNNTSVIPPELHKYYGSIIDVGYFWHPIMRFSSHQKSVSQNMKYAFMSEHRHVKFDIPKIRFRKDIDWLNEHKIPYVNMGHSQYLCYLECGFSAHSGILTLHHLLNQPLKSLYVTGFSFHKSDTIEVSQDDRHRVYNSRDYPENWDRENYIGENVNKLLDIITEDEYISGKRWFSKDRGKIIEVDGENYLVLWKSGIKELCHHDSLRLGCHDSIMEEKIFFHNWVANDPRIKLDSFLSSLVP